MRTQSDNPDQAQSLTDPQNVSLPKGAKVKVLWLCTPLESRYGVMNILCGWASRIDYEQFDVTLAHYSPNPEELRARLAPFPKLKVVYLPQLWSQSRLYVPALRALVALLRRERFDIVHTIFVQSDILGTLAARLAGIPAVVSSVMGYLVNPVGGGRWKRPVYQVAYRLAQRKIDRLIAITRTTRKQLVEDFGVPAAKIEVIYSGVHQVACPRPARAAGRFVIGFVGMLIPPKGTATLIEAVPEILRQISGARFVVVGDGPERGRLEAQARDLGVADRFEFLGFCENVPALMAGFDVFAFTSRPGYDGLPRVILEAMGQRTPVVASRTEPIEEIVTDDCTGWLFTPGDASELAAAVGKIHANPDAAAAVAERAYRRALPISVESEVSQMEGIYRGLVASRTAGAEPSSRV